MVQEKPNFIKGCVDNGVEEEVATKIWDKMEKFCEYAFNKSHSTGYAIIAAQTAWLKYYHKSIFMTEILNSYLQKADELSFYIQRFKESGINFLKPDVNNSDINFKSVGESEILFGLSGIKNMGKAAKDIIDERNQNGLYKSFYDFLKRTSKFINTRNVDALIDAGAFDSLHKSRKGMKEKVDDLLKSVKANAKNNIIGQVGFLGAVAVDEGQSVEDYDIYDKLKLEYESAGMYISSHPAEVYRQDKVKRSVHLSSNEFPYLKELSKKDPCLTFAVVKNIRIFKSKDRFYPIVSFDLEDATKLVKGVMFQDPNNSSDTLSLRENDVVIAMGEYVKSRKYGYQFRVKKIIENESHLIRLRSPDLEAVS